MIEQQPDPLYQVPETHKYDRFMNPPPREDRGRLMMVAGAVFLVVCLIYGHECRSEAKAAGRAFEDQKAMNKSTREVAWMQGFQAGCNSTANSLMIAIQQNMGTNAQAFVNSNVLWEFNLMRPK